MMVGRYIILLGVLFITSCNINKNQFTIVSVSMNPNLEKGDIVTINNQTKDIAYGDIVACVRPMLYEPEDIISISRIVGLPGDSIRIEQDICVINGKKNFFKERQKAKQMLHEFPFDEYLEVFPNGKNILILTCSSCGMEKYNTQTEIIPKDHYFIMGDNRSDAYDSRYIGPIHKDKIVGKVIKIKKKKE